MSNYIVLSLWDLVLASLFLILNAAISLWLGLGLERQLIVSACRMIVQLLMVGLLLKVVDKHYRVEGVRARWEARD